MAARRRAASTVYRTVDARHSHKTRASVCGAHRFAVSLAHLQYTTFTEEVAPSTLAHFAKRPVGKGVITHGRDHSWLTTTVPLPRRSSRVALIIRLLSRVAIDGSGLDHKSHMAVPAHNLCLRSTVNLSRIECVLCPPRGDLLICLCSGLVPTCLFA